MKTTIFGLMAAATLAGIPVHSEGVPMDDKTSTYSDAELQKRLTPLQYQVTRLDATEPPFENAYWNNHEEGLYVDIVSGAPLFSSKDKFESGTGWPSFTAPLDGRALILKTDRSLFMARTEVRSKASNSHLGHVFDDGPAPTGKRYCMNSASLRFIPAAALAKEGYGKYAALFTKTAAGGKTQKATFAAGCFWGVQAAFDKVKGVSSSMAGYTGGKDKNPTYHKVCSGTTGHAESVDIEFDPAKVTYNQLLDVFWGLADATAPRDDSGQYRSAIFYHDGQQKKEAEASRDKLAASGKVSGPITTQIAPAKDFYPAEDYHQKYYEKQHNVLPL